MMKELIMSIFITLMLLLLSSAKSEPLAPALYVLGDSILDSGNNNPLPTLAKANFLPYGMNFPDGPTGRFTDGRTIVDFIAEFIGLPYAPPYMGTSMVAESEPVITGLNFASGSCGILPQTGSDLGKCLNFPEQVDLFETTVTTYLPRHYNDPEELSNYLSKSLFAISIGNNDYLINYLNKDYPTREIYTPEAFATLLITNLALQLQRLYALGARKVITFELGAIGCIPFITRQTQHSGKCVDEINQFVVPFNNQLAPMLQNLTSSLPNSSFILGHGHGLSYDAAINPSKYGLSDSSNPCCVAWFNGTAGCIMGLGDLACKQPEKEYFFDAYHLTETIYREVATQCFNGSSLCIPQNIKQLLSQD